VYRHYTPTYGPLSGEGARRQGGRWNPPDSVSVLYTASDTDTVDAEFGRQLALARVAPTSVRPRQLATLRVRLQRILDLREPEALDALGVTMDDLMADDPSLTRAIGEAAQHLGYEAIVAPSAAGGPGHVVALFMTNRAPASSIELLSVERYVRREGT